MPLVEIASKSKHDDSVSILVGDGHGKFAATAAMHSVGNYPQSLAADDFNGDAHWDLATANYFGMDVGIVFGYGDGTFGSRVYLCSAAPRHTLSEIIALALPLATSMGTETRALPSPTTEGLGFCEVLGFF
jgi:hypothetical protein